MIGPVQTLVRGDEHAARLAEDAAGPCGGDRNPGISAPPPGMAGPQGRRRPRLDRDMTRRHPGLAGVDRAGRPVAIRHWCRPGACADPGRPSAQRCEAVAPAPARGKTGPLCRPRDTPGAARSTVRVVRRTFACVSRFRSRRCVRSQTGKGTCDRNGLLSRLVVVGGQSHRALYAKPTPRPPRGWRRRAPVVRGDDPGELRALRDREISVTIIVRRV